MEQHWKLKDLGQTILFAAIYFVIVLAATIMGGIHPLLYLLVTTLIALLAWIPYMYVLAFGELANMLLISLIVCAILAEIVRRRMGYKNYKGVVMSYILFSLSNIGSPLYVWIFPEYAVSEAVEEMSTTYAETLSTLTSLWFMILAVVATFVVSAIAGALAKKVYSRQLENAGIM